jgi:hypothetical protein
MPSRNVFDQNGRNAAKLDGVGFRAWVLRRFHSAPPLVFDRWEDARRLAVVPGLERVSDLVGVLRRTDQAGKQAWLINEIETEPVRHQLKRVGVYTLLLSVEVSGGRGPEDEPPVGAALLVLTGRREPATLKLKFPDLPGETTVSPLVINLCDENAAQTLKEIRDGTTALCILPWIPLMAGGTERDLVKEWKDVALLEEDEELRATYVWYALVFADLTPGQVNWLQGLEGWMERESQTVLNVQKRGAAKAEVETLRATTLEVVEVRLANPVPESIRLAIEGTNDPQTLRRWHRLALTVASVKELGAAMTTP